MYWLFSWIICLVRPYVNKMPNVKNAYHNFPELKMILSKLQNQWNNKEKKEKKFTFQKLEVAVWLIVYNYNQYYNDLFSFLAFQFLQNNYNGVYVLYMTKYRI